MDQETRKFNIMVAGNRAHLVPLDDGVTERFGTIFCTPDPIRQTVRANFRITKRVVNASEDEQIVQAALREVAAMYPHHRILR